ncbi:NAD(P)/FAD-dependent oxidoreductase [Devosia sp. PTR5]|uniref:NAD(P)/FAD-dependent oxidoreductase n=1 Tax=Devosia oryzisoli TaxID=2774138 RepID=A0A927FV33_9HYPH|nr:FAD-dependent oxidoreductase [Devosia oryzisoli]MBD8066860.1 NAD(P)/FAD-dependent oxidoreductase [Devosia oryzisoli]
MADPLRPDLCIIGAGALGVALARHARRFDVSVTLVDRGRPEPGDQPEVYRRLAALAASAGLAQAMREGETLGLASIQPKLVYKSVAARAIAVAEGGAVLESVEHLRAQGVEVMRGEPRFTEGRTLAVGDAVLRPRSIILALGGEPMTPSIPGLSEIDFLTPDTIVENGRKLSHLLVIGGGAEAVALAQIHRRLGCAVTLVPQGALLAGFDPEAVSVLADALAAEGLDLVREGQIEEIQPRSQGIGVRLSTQGGQTRPLDVSHVLLATERRPDVAGLGIEHLKLSLSADGLLSTGPLGRTANRAVRAVGYAAGQRQWNLALAHGREVVEAVLTGRGRPSGALPMIVPTEPGLVQIGHAEPLARRGRADAKVLRATLAENEAARAMGKTVGSAKLMLDAHDRITGGSIVAPMAAELGALVSLAMQARMTTEQLAAISLPYPSLAALISQMAENHPAGQRVSPWTQRRQALRRLLPR